MIDQRIHLRQVNSSVCRQNPNDPLYIHSHKDKIYLANQSFICIIQPGISTWKEWNYQEDASFHFLGISGNLANNVFDQIVKVIQLVVSDSLRPHRLYREDCMRQHKRRLYSWTSPDGQYQNQIDCILCSQRWRSSIQSAKTRLGVDCGLDHELLIAIFT